MKQRHLNALLLALAGSLLAPAAAQEIATAAAAEKRNIR